MLSFEQTPFGSAEFAENPEPRCPCILILDTSSSMGGRPIKELNDGLQVLADELAEDSLAAKRVEISIVAFGPTRVEREWQTADSFSPPQLTAKGQTPMGEAINTALNLIEDRKRMYRANGVSYYRPWAFLITDGAPTDSWSSAASRVHDMEEGKSLSFFAIGVENANFDTLSKISVREPLRLDSLRFRDMFIWLSSSLSSVSHSRPGETVPLLNPATPNGWASID